MVEKLSKSVREFLADQQIGHLATVDEDGNPHVVPVCFALSGEEIVIIIDDKPKTTSRLKRIRNIEKNSAIAFIVDFYDSNWLNLRWVMIRGRAVVRISANSDQPALDALQEKYPQYRSMDLSHRPLICIQSETVIEWSSGQPAFDN